VIRVLRMLEAGGFITRNADTPPRFAPARATDQIAIVDLIDHIRRYEETTGGPRATKPCAAIADVEQRIQAALTATLEDLTLRELARRIESGDEALVDPMSVG